LAGRNAFAGTLAAIAVLLSVSACGNSSTSSSSSRPTASSSTSVKASATPAPGVNYRALNPALFPEVDTPIAQATPQLKQVWTAYDVTVIPSRHTLDTMPEPPKVINKTGGQVSDADAQAMAWAEYRENAFIGWMELHTQPGLNNHLRDSGLFTGDIGDAVRAGKSVTAPPCDLYAGTMAVVTVDQPIVAFEQGRGFSVTAAYALVGKYAPCTTSITGGAPLFSSSVPGTIVETGSIRPDDVLGSIYYSESGRDCPSGNSVPACVVLP